MVSGKPSGALGRRIPCYFASVTRNPARWRKWGNPNEIERSQRRPRQPTRPPVRHSPPSQARAGACLQAHGRAPARAGAIVDGCARWQNATKSHFCCTFPCEQAQVSAKSHQDALLANTKRMEAASWMR